MPADDTANGAGAGAGTPPDPLCFVLMPFGRKSDATGASIDFDAVYHELIAPAVRAAGSSPSARTRR
jgi:hypothetical protein